MWQTNRKPLTY